MGTIPDGCRRKSTSVDSVAGAPDSDGKEGIEPWESISIVLSMQGSRPSNGQQDPGYLYLGQKQLVMGLVASDWLVLGLVFLKQILSLLLDVEMLSVCRW